jgi:two-component system, NarL family, sensor kinase
MDGVLLEITDRKVAEETLNEFLGRSLQTQDEERRRIARELHDNTSPLLTALTGKLYTLKNTSPGPDAPIATALDESLKLTNDISGVIRNVSYLLNPRLDENGLLASLRWFMDSFTNRTGIPVEMKFPQGLTELSREAQVALFRIVQESLTNVLRYSGSAGVRVRIVVKGRILMLEVSDEGRGRPARVDHLKEVAVVLGFGIAGIRERMRQLGGHVEISSDGSFTMVKATLPLEALKD